MVQLPGPTPGEEVIHLLFRCLRDMLLHTELLIPSMLRFSAHIFHAGFLVSKATGATFDHIASRIDNLVSECEHQGDDFG